MSNAVLYALTVLIWGSTWFAIEFQLGVVAPEVSLVYRYGGAALILFGWCRLRQLRLRFKPADHLRFFMLGLLLFGVNYIIAYRAQIYLSSALTAIAFSTMVWMNIINARIFFGTRAGHAVLAGALLGVAGIITLFAPQVVDLSLSDTVLFGSLLAVVSALVASFGNMVSQAAQRARLPVLQSNAWGMFYGAAINAVAAGLAGLPFRFDFSAGYVISLAYLIVFGSIVAFGAYLTLLGRIGAHKAGYAMVMFPVVALAISMAFEGLRIDVPTIIGTALVIVGNLFVLNARRDPAGTQSDRISRVAAHAAHPQSGYASPDYTSTSDAAVGQVGGVPRQV